MSFILEALKKSEGERQRLGNTAIADLPLGRRTQGQPWWVLLVAALLIINLVALIAVLVREHFSVNDQSKAALNAANITSVANATLSDAPAKSTAPTSPVPSLAQDAAPPAQVEYATVPRAEMEIANAGASVPEGPTLVKPVDARQTSATVANSTTTVAPPNLHIDLHVYSKNPHERFVLINMRHYTEGQRLLEGPIVEQITPDGVVLNDNGERYQLSRN